MLKGQRIGPTRCAAHRYEDQDEPLSTAEDPVRLADREDCVWYSVCLDRAAKARRGNGQRQARCVCTEGCGKYMQERRTA